MTDLATLGHDQTDVLAYRQPHDLNIEQAVLGAILNGYPVEDVPLTSNDFHHLWHAQVFDACTKITTDGHQPDVQLVAAHLNDGHHLDLFDLVQVAAIPSNVPAHTRIIRDHARRRQLLGNLARATQQAHTPDCDPDEIANQLRTAFDEQTQTTTTAIRLADAIPTMIDRIEGGHLRGDTTPWPELDRWITLQPGRLYTFGARPGVGKSLLGQAFAAHMSRHHHKATYVASLEMPVDEYVQRFLAAESGVNLSALDYGRLHETQWAAISTAVHKLDAWNIYLDDRSVQTLATIRSGARTIARQHTLGLIVIDYLQLVTPTDKRVKREEQVAELTKGFKGLAKDLHVPVLLIAQLNREGVRDKRRPRMSDLRESGAIEQDSDVIGLLHEEPVDEGEPPSNIVELLIEKNRGGRNHGRINLLRKGWIARIEQADRQTRQTQGSAV